jgi:hypothetical protein
MNSIFTGRYNFKHLINLQKQLYNEFGDIVKFDHIPTRNDFLFIFNPDDISKVFRQEGHWPERPSFHCLRYYRTVLRHDTFKGFDGVLNE